MVQKLPDWLTIKWTQVVAKVDCQEHRYPTFQSVHGENTHAPQSLNTPTNHNQHRPGDWEVKPPPRTMKSCTKSSSHNSRLLSPPRRARTWRGRTSKANTDYASSVLGKDIEVYHVNQCSSNATSSQENWKSSRYEPHQQEVTTTRQETQILRTLNRAERLKQLSCNTE